MAVNDNQPITTVPWRLTAANPGTLDIRVDVQDPVIWEVGSGTTPSPVVPLSGRFPIVTLSNSTLAGVKGRFTLFIPDSPDRDDIIEALIDARYDVTVPYYTWQALDGTQSWRVQFDPQERMSISNLGPHRVVQVGFIQIAPSTSTPSGAGASGDRAVPDPLPKPSFGTNRLVAEAGANIPIFWFDITAPSPIDFIGLFALNNPDVGESNQFGKKELEAASIGTGNLEVEVGTPIGDYQLRLYLGVGPRVITGPTVQIVAGAIYAITSPSPSNRVLGYGQSYTITWSGLTNPDPSDYISFSTFDADGFMYEVSRTSMFGLANGSTSIAVPQNIPMPSSPYIHSVDTVFTAVRNTGELQPIGMGKMAPLGCELENDSSENVIELFWHGLATVTAGDRVGIIPNGDVNLDNAYDTHDITDTFGSHVFDFGNPPGDVLENVTVRGCLELDDGRVFVSDEIYVIRNWG